MNKIDLIQEAINKAERLESKLTPKEFDIGGYTSPKIRHLMNNLGDISRNYLEIGVHLGATFMAANYANAFSTSTAIDNFSEFNENDPKKHFLQNMGTMRFMLIDQDCWTMSTSFYNPIDLYLYDGGHDLESQEKALTHFLPAMAKEFIFCVDDYGWDVVQKGTASGIEKSGVEVVAHWPLGLGDQGSTDGYWNGFGVFLLRKK